MFLTCPFALFCLHQSISLRILACSCFFCPPQPACLCLWFSLCLRPSNVTSIYDSTLPAALPSLYELPSKLTTSCLCPGHLTPNPILFYAFCLKIPATQEMQLQELPGEAVSNLANSFHLPSNTAILLTPPVCCQLLSPLLSQRIKFPNHNPVKSVLHSVSPVLKLDTSKII